MATKQEVTLKKGEIHVLYFTDPVCSTCWLIEPYLKKFMDDYSDILSISYVTGGMLESWDAYKVADPSRSKEEVISSLWNQLREKHEAILDGNVWLENPVKSSFPASIGYHAAVCQGEEKAIDYFSQIRRKLFVENKNIAQESVIISAARAARLNTDQFIIDLIDPETERRFKRDLELKSKWDVKRFPTLVFINSKGDYFFDDLVFKNISEKEILDHWNKIIEELLDDGIATRSSRKKIIDVLKKNSGLTQRDLRILCNIDDTELNAELLMLEAEGIVTNETLNTLTIWHYLAPTFRINKRKFSVETATIVGSGIAGLSSGILLSRNGVETNILERQSENDNKGLAFLILKNGVDALETIGVKTKFLQTANQINFFKAIRPDGSLIQKKTLDHCYAIERGHLVQLLKEKYGENAISYNEKTVLAHTGKIDKPAVQNHTGKQTSSDIVVACDGFHSKIRGQLFPDYSTTSVGESEVVCIVKSNVALQSEDEFQKIIDVDQGVCMGLIPLKNNWYVWFLQYAPHRCSPENNQPEGLRNYIENLTFEYPEPFKLAVQQSDFTKAFVWQAERMDLLPAFHKDGVVLVGDAAHPLLSFTSQGANSALEDTVVLAQCLGNQSEEETLDQVFQRYYNLRKDFIMEYIHEGDSLIHAFLHLQDELNYKLPLAVH